MFNMCGKYSTLIRSSFECSKTGTDPTGKNIYLNDIWPSREEVHQVEEEHVILSMFKALKEKIETKEPVALQSLENAHVLLYLGDSVTTDHISPAGSIAKNSAAAKYLMNRGFWGT
ncbi:iron-responsive element-binding protein 2-like isoform X2 [Callithrix jacchus]